MGEDRSALTDTRSLSEESTFEERPWWIGVASIADPAGFGASAIAYVFPLFYLHVGQGVSAFSSPYRFGIELFFASIFYMTAVGWPLGVQAFAGFSLPLLMATAGLLLQKRLGRLGALARFFCAIVGLSGLISIYLAERVDWQLGFYVAAVGFVVATIAAGVRSVASFRYPPD